MNRKMPIIEEFYFVKTKSPLIMPIAGDPCNLFNETTLDCSCSKQNREEQYLRKFKNVMIEEDQQKQKFLILQKELSLYFETLRKFKL
ncbi:unnamed protein product [Paramecium primaurelia]|uniref:Uncharacterized protein n=2 Tax=Paramecium TaxID=5884 RepID=A0A8S1WAA7_9CILI|nr:unnamed protein product [Paramecium primaurelia]CAD8185325.1 unnamed protein product [Paramecium pentaurelia]